MAAVIRAKVSKVKLWKYSNHSIQLKGYFADFKPALCLGTVFAKSGARYPFFSLKFFLQTQSDTYSAKESDVKAVVFGNYTTAMNQSDCFIWATSF